MDSGNSGSMQSSSGGDEEYESRGHESISAFLNSSSGNLGPLSNHPPPPPLPSSHYHTQQPSPFYDPISNYLDTFPRSPPPQNPNSLLNLDMVWSRGLRSDPNCTDLGGLMSSTSSSPPIPGRGGPYNGPSIPPPPSSAPVDQSAGTRNSKKRSRASRRAPTTVLTTDTSNFRAMVQEFTGIPAPPFSASPFPRNRLDLFNSSSSMPPPYLLRPFAQKPSFSSLPIGSSSSSSSLVSSSMADVFASTTIPATTTTTNATNATNTSNSTSNSNYQLPSTDLGLLKQNLLSMSNPNFAFQSILQSPPPLPPNQSKYPLPNLPPFTAKSQGQLTIPVTTNTDPHLKMGVLDGFGMNHGGHIGVLPTEGISRSDNSPSWRQGLGLDGGGGGGDQGHSRPFNGNYGNSPRGSSCKINYSASSSDFNAEKGSENVSSRGEGGSCNQMGFSRFTAIISSEFSRITTPQSPTGLPASSGLLPPAGSNYRSRLAGPAQKNNLRLSSSLQDFSTFSKLDPEEGDVDFGIEKGSAHVKPHHNLQRENAGSSFSKEKGLQATPFTRKKWVRAAVCLLCLPLFIFLVYVCSKYFSNYSSRDKPHYYVILDCGSTGTRVYVYEWSLDHRNGQGSLPIVLRSLPENLERESMSRNGRAYHRMETEPGFDKLVHNASGLRTAIKPLLHWAEKQIPKHAHKSTSLFLYATAGVRRLPSSDSEWLLDKAWSILKKSSFLCQKDWVKIISGMEEAYYGWIALNYHMDTLGSSPKKATFGALDLGGSSLQVTFETEQPLHDETSLNLSIGAVNHHLSAYSLSGYGLNDAFDKSVVHILKRHLETTKTDVNSGKIELRHPCLQTGYKEQYICSQCTALNHEGSPLIGGRNMGKGRSGIAIKLLGTPQWEQCSALAKTMVNLSEWSDLSSGIDCELQPCALTDNLPRPHGQFNAMSGFFVVFKFFNLSSEAALDDVLEKGQQFCEKTWEIAKNSVAPQPFIEQYCFRAPYIVSLLRDGLHISDSQVVIGSGSITWTLGVALSEAGRALSRIEVQSHRFFNMKLNPTILFVMLFISLIVLICAISCVGKWMPRFFRRSYLPLFRHNSGTATSVLNISSPFRFQRWSPISSGDGRVKMPLSPTVAGSEQRPFSMGYGFGGSSIELMESSLYPSGGSVSHSYSSGSLGQMQFDNGVGSFWPPHRGQNRLQSRRSQSREDLSSSVSEAHMVKV